jgi:hypothetical protein
MKKSVLCTFSFLILGLFHLEAVSDRDAKLEELKTLQSAMNQAQQAQNLDEANKIAQQITQIVAQLQDMKRVVSSETAPAPANPAVTQAPPQEPSKPAPVAKRPDSYEDEILRLADRRDAEMAQALAPIERRFDLGSQQLLRKTMQSGNLEAANELKGMLENPQKTAAQHDKTANLPQEKEMVRLMEQREKEIAQASAPIQKRFELGTQQILRKALQNGDLEAANKLKATIQDVSVSTGKFTSAKSANKKDFEIESTPQGLVIKKYLGKSPKVVIPERIGGQTVVAIDAHSFERNSDIEELELPKSVEEIRRDAFCGAKNLKNVRFSEGLKIIGEGAFAYTALSEIHFPKTLQEISKNAFLDTKTLKTVQFSEGLKIIGYGAFARTSIAEIYLPDSLEKIETLAFLQCVSLQKVRIPEKTVVHKQSFSACNAEIIRY